MKPDSDAFLLKLLAQGPVPNATVEAQAKAAGIALRTLDRARKRLGVQRRRIAFGKGGYWLMSLPDRAAKSTDNIKHMPGVSSGVASFQHAGLPDGLAEFEALLTAARKQRLPNIAVRMPQDRFLSLTQAVQEAEGQIPQIVKTGAQDAQTDAHLQALLHHMSMLQRMWEPYR